MKRHITDILRRIGLHKTAFEIYEVVKVVDFRTLYRNARYWGKTAPDGLPIPSLKLIVLVAGTSDISRFLEDGKQGVQSIVDTLEKNGLNIDDFQAILDFGCGCGRMTRHWNSLKRAKVYGTDYNPQLIDWCRRNLPFARFEINHPSPPLNYGDEKFDFIYAFSVFTHLAEPLQFSWINELSRVLKPGGHLLVTTHGEPYFEQLTQSEQEDFQAGRLVVRYKETAGTNLCSAFHPVKYVREKLASGFEVVDFIQGEGSQDIFLLKKR